MGIKEEEVHGQWNRSEIIFTKITLAESCYQNLKGMLIILKY